MQVTIEKKKQDLKKKQWADDKRADEEKRKKTDQEKEKANAGTVTISPPNNITLCATCHAIIGQGNVRQY
jgi:cytochrome c553